MDKSKIEQAKEGIRWFLEHNNPLPYHEEGLQTALQVLSEYQELQFKIDLGHTWKEKAEKLQAELSQKDLENKDLIRRLAKGMTEISKLKAIVAQDYTTGRMTELEAQLTKVKAECEVLKEKYSQESMNNTMLMEERDDFAKDAYNFEEQNKIAVEALRLILPMAKGYAYRNYVGSNMEYIRQAEQSLDRLAEGQDK